MKTAHNYLINLVSRVFLFLFKDYYSLFRYYNIQ